MLGTALICTVGLRRCTRRSPASRPRTWNCPDLYGGIATFVAVTTPRLDVDIPAWNCPDLYGGIATAVAPSGPRQSRSEAEFSPTQRPSPPGPLSHPHSHPPGEGEPPTLAFATSWAVAPPLPGGRECGWERGTGGEGGRAEAPATITLTGPWSPPSGACWRWQSGRGKSGGDGENVRATSPPARYRPPPSRYRPSPFEVPASPCQVLVSPFEVQAVPLRGTGLPLPGTGLPLRGTVPLPSRYRPLPSRYRPLPSRYTPLPSRYRPLPSRYTPLPSRGTLPPVIAPVSLLPESAPRMQSPPRRICPRGGTAYASARSSAIFPA